MEDEIMQLFGSEKIIDIMEAYDIPEDEYVSGEGLDAAFKKAQDFVESKNLDSRLYLYKYDSVASFQRKFIYDLRDSLLENEPNFLAFLKRAIRETLDEILELRDSRLIAKEAREIFHIEASPEEIEKSLGLRPGGNKPDVMNEWFNPFYKEPAKVNLSAAEEKLYKYLENLALKIKKDPEVYSAAQNLVLEIIDNQWSSQLELMDVLKEEANLFSYASQDPLIDFILEGRKLFQQSQSAIKRQLLSAIFLRLEQQGEID